MRPALRPGLLATWRDQDTVQLGVDARRAVAVTGMSQAADVIRLLRQMGDLGPFLDLAHRHDVDAILVVADREADELDKIVARAGGAVLAEGGLGGVRAAGRVRNGWLGH